MTLFARQLLAGSTLEAARAVLGALMVREEPGRPARVGRIVEVEAYIGTDDLASHARFGRTSRNAVMFGPPGIAYVYLVYGMYDCLNVVTEPDGRPAALLIRAVEPVEGVEEVRAARERWALRHRQAAERIAGLASNRLTSGPGLVAAGFDLRREHSGIDLLDPASPIRLEAPGRSDRPPRIVVGPRVGIGSAPPAWQDVAWRFVDADSPAVSRRPPPATEQGG
ncbi:MAG TPA: DNA-3-methyladenine glycosylase [Candidatus Eisenbacteria bacterium]|nr:DNA-3-methyladenine glycosylase [Candidatus Eisenbacteria bacterium]